jgi:hypothetical protein
MTTRVFGLMLGAIFVVAALSSVAQPQASAQAATAKAADLPRLPNGKPDLSGVWDKPRVTDITRDSNECGSGAPVKGCTQKGAGTLTYTAAGDQLNKSPRFDYAARCLPWGYTRAMQTAYPVEFVHTPKRFAILFESNNVFHIVPTDGREHPKNLEPSWMGNSVGRYEGDTLVIDTIGFNGKTWIDTAEHLSSDALHVVERIRLIDADHLEYEVTFDDPKIYAKPFKNTRVFVRMRPGDELMEWWCMENNKDLLEGRLSETHINP